jgi:hypothetical protein
MSQIGIYAVDSTELNKPPSDREYELRGLYDEQRRTWSDSTDSRLHCLFPDDKGEEYSLEEIHEKIETATLQVYPEDEVPGTVTEPSVSPKSFQSASD